ncbi:Solute carrier family 35 member G1 [Araneus ventricosus]|uniref:Solute carrier family 35 member G1 n=1 Tax=Araneus ventricosus TaxID=182803 RepID=A0A4Y1ZV44_ARAVE|nr:Solute carrier family 35 member G1 [Araneus ventricosus]
MHSKRRSFHFQSASSEQRTNVDDKSNIHFPWKGLLLATVSAICYSIDAVFVKSMKNLHPIQLALYRFITLLFMCMPEVVKVGLNPFGPKDVRFFLLLRGALGGISLFLVYTSYRFLPLGESFIITSSMPIFVTFAACIFLKEPCGIFQSVLVVLTVTGIIFTTKIPSRLMGEEVIYTTENIYGILAAVGALLGRTCMMLSVRRAKKADHSVMMFNYSWVSLLESFVMLPMLIDFKWHRCGIQIFYIMLIGVINYTAQTLLTLSLKCELAGPVSTIMAAVYIILAFLWQTFLFHDIPDYFTITGAVIVGFCITLTSLRKWVSSLPETSPQRQKLTWMLV